MLTTQHVYSLSCMMTCVCVCSCVIFIVLPTVTQCAFTQVNDYGMVLV